MVARFNNLARVLVEQGDLAGACLLMERALAINKRCLSTRRVLLSLTLTASGRDTKQVDTWGEDRQLFYQPCFATRLGGVSGGMETQGWRDSSHTAMVGAGKFGSAKLPMATATYPGKPSLSQ